MKRLRMSTAVAGFLAAALSVALDDHRVAWVGISLLALSLLLKLLARRRARHPGDDPLL